MFVTRAIPVYKALFHAERLNVRKKVFDCGAGGARPPLFVFHAAGYETAGIDMAEGALRLSQQFEIEHHCSLHIVQGDMRHLELPDSAVGCCYSHNSVFHMRKRDVIASVLEMIRITEPGGVIYFNLLSKRDSCFGIGSMVEADTFEDGSLHSYFDDDEFDPIVEPCSLIEKCCVTHHRYDLPEPMTQSFIEYFLRKPPVD